MKLEILQENLNLGINTVCRVLTNRPQVAILSNLLLVASPGNLEITASNLETTVTVTVGAKVEEKGEFTVPGRTFQEIVSGLSAEKIDLEVKEGFLTLSEGKFKGKINGTPAAEFPKVLESLGNKKPTASWKLDKLSFSKVLNRLIFSAATDDGRAVLTGILFAGGKEELVLAAADGFRLSADKISLEGKNNPEVKFIVPAKALLEVSRLLNESKGDKEEKEFALDYFEDKSEVIFDLGVVKIITRLIAGNFPDY